MAAYLCHKFIFFKVNICEFVKCKTKTLLIIFAFYKQLQMVNVKVKKNIEK